MLAIAATPAVVARPSRGRRSLRIALNFAAIFWAVSCLVDPSFWIPGAVSVASGYGSFFRPLPKPPLDDG